MSRQGSRVKKPSPDKPHIYYHQGTWNIAITGYGTPMDKIRLACAWCHSKNTDRDIDWWIIKSIDKNYANGGKREGAE